MISFSIGVLSYNESRNMPLVVDKLVETLSLVKDLSFKILIIDNGSLDDTEESIKQLEKKYDNVSHILIPENKGYGYGVKQGLSSLSGDVVGFIWGDNQFDAGVIGDMIERFIKDPSLKLVKTYRTKRYDGRLRLVVSTFYQVLFKMLYGGNIKDINSGPKLFRSGFLNEKIIPLKYNDWFVDAEMMIKTVRNISSDEIAELPIEFFPRKFGKSNVKFSTCFEFFKNLFIFRFKK